MTPAAFMTLARISAASFYRRLCVHCEPQLALHTIMKAMIGMPRSGLSTALLLCSGQRTRVKTGRPQRHVLVVHLASRGHQAWMLEVDNPKHPRRCRNPHHDHGQPGQRGQPDRYRLGQPLPPACYPFQRRMLFHAVTPQAKMASGVVNVQQTLLA